MKVLLENVAVYEMWSLVAVERNVLRQISKAMCNFQPPSTKRNSLDFRLEQKPHFLMKIGIVERTAPSGLYAEDPEIKIARETAMFYAISNAFLILTNGQTQVHILWSAAQQPCDFFGSYCSPGATGQDRDAPQPGDNRVTEKPQDWGCASDESQWGMRMQHPCLPAWHMGKQGTLAWAKHTHSTGMAQLAQSIRTTVVVVRTSSSMLTRHVHKSSRHRMPLWSVFRARYLAGLNQHNCSGICGVMQI